LGEECTTDDNCRHTFANCIGVCRCLPGYVISENGRNNCRHTFANCIGVCRCLPGYVISENGRRCNCRHTFANCIGVCRCLPGYVISENGRRCLQAATEFTDPCDELAQCSTYLSGSFCQNNTCTCNPGSQATDQLALAISGDADAHQDITTPQTVVASLRAV
ncbi:hypothetical protein QE152_g41304, partial [Popillia japonica]